MFILRGGMRYLVLLVLFSGCAATYPVPPAIPTAPGLPDRFERVVFAPGSTCVLYRSAQPTDAEWKRLVSEYGIRIEIKLNGLESLVRAPAGVVTFKEPINVFVEPSQEQLARIEKEACHSQQPALMHCSHGEDRTGLGVGYVQYKSGMSAIEAYLNMVSMRFHPYPALMKAWVKAVGW